MPLEHSESLPVQQHCVALFEIFYEEVDPAIRDAVKSNLDYAKLHCEIIRRFGRFPHRNTVLGRQSTEDEVTYLRESDLNFGQGN